MAFPKTVPTLKPLISTPEGNMSVQDRNDFVYCALCYIQRAIIFLCRFLKNYFNAFFICKLTQSFLDSIVCLHLEGFLF